jgi:hypothetical protein
MQFLKKKIENGVKQLTNLWNFDSILITQKSLVKIGLRILKKDFHINNILFHVAPHIELVYRIWNENQSELFNFLPFETMNSVIFLDLKSPLQKVGVIMSKNNYTCFHNQVINLKEVPIDKFKGICFVKRHWNKMGIAKTTKCH